MLQPTRRSDRVSYEREPVHRVLDEALVCHIGLVVQGQPHVLPTMHVRADHRVYVHASSAARLAMLARSTPIRMCLTVSILDGVVLARSAFHHSLNYRSVVIHADAQLVQDDEEKTRALTVLVDRVGTGRSDQCRPPTRRELAATALLALDLDAAETDVALKSRSGPPLDEAGDLELDFWAGVVPVQLTAGAPQSSCDLPVPSGLMPALPSAVEQASADPRTTAAR